MSNLQIMRNNYIVFYLLNVATPFTYFPISSPTSPSLSTA